MDNQKAAKLLRKINNVLSICFDSSKTVASSVEIDVIIPVVKKDLRILPLCLAGIRDCVQHPIKNIYVVAPSEEEIIRFCQDNYLQYIDETSVLGFGPKELDLKIIEANGSIIDRSGWLFQQLIKLSGTIGTCPNYLCIDADHILLQPHAFISSANEPVFYMSYERHQPYYDMIKTLTGITNISKQSYVAHKMIVNRKQLAALHHHISDYCGQYWIDAILSRYDRKQISGFSEYEIYGNYVKNKMMIPWKQHSLKLKYVADYQLLRKKYGRIYRSITFPEYY
ncbi:MAG: DUF6492 family protein [Prevotellaceae bacterium]|jgi:hypothetical protein|nr:DUF6492 family protein [Prevotellaceae bacterium]